MNRPWRQRCFMMAGIWSFSLLLSLAAAPAAFAGQWKTGEDDPESWWYDHQDGTYAVGWELIDSDGDGTGEWYLFDEDGWLITDYVTSDGYELDMSGAWVVDGSVVHVRMDGSGGTVSGGGTQGADSSAGAAGNAGTAQEVPAGIYRLDRLIYTDGSSREASASRTWYLECALWGEGLMTASRSENAKGYQTLHYQEYQKEGDGRWVCRDEETGLVTRLVWNRADDTIEVSDEDLTRHYVKQ